MPLAAALKEAGDSVRIRISGKNQITIPSAARKRYSFGEHALCTFTEEGILIQPIDPADNSDDLTLKLLRHLIQEGHQGDELLAKYEEPKPEFFDLASRVLDAEKGFEEGRGASYPEVSKRIRDKHGL